MTPATPRLRSARRRTLLRPWARIRCRAVIRLREVLAALLTVACAPIAFAGCSIQHSLSRAEYRTQASRMCRDLHRRTDALPLPESNATEEFVHVGRRALSLQRDALGRIQALDAPSAEEQTVGRWLDRVDAALDASAASLQAQSDGDLAAARVANARGAAATGRADDLARSLGIDACVTPAPS